MRTVSDAVEMERAMRHEAQEARRTAEIELQEVSAELNLLLEAASDGTDIGHDPCPRCGYHVVANPELPAGHAPTLTTCCPYCGQHMPYGGYFCGQCGMREAGDAAGQIPTGLRMRVATLIVAACWGISVSELQRYVLQFQPVLAWQPREAVLQMAELRDAWFHALNYVDAGEEYR